MLSESARMTTAQEARFRIADPNSRPRAIAVIALDAPSEKLVRRLATQRWNRATFMTAPAHGMLADHQTVSGWLSDLAGHAMNLLEQIKAADLVVTVSTAGHDSESATMIAEACHLNKVMTTALVMAPSSTPDDTLAKTLTPLRRHAAMLVVASGEEYVEAMLTALRA